MSHLKAALITAAIVLVVIVVDDAFGITGSIESALKITSKN